MAEGDEYLDYLDKIHVRVGGETLECFVRDKIHLELSFVYSSQKDN